MKYNAFISYRHTEPDMEIAKTLHRALETFHVPGKVRKETGMRRIERVFRDQEELPIGSDLGDNIRAALQESEFLIVICSPRTLQSDWVLREIDTFLSMHDREHILAVLIEGEPNESFPPALLRDEEGNPVEPLAADVRGATRSERRKKLRTEFLRLAAPLLHCSYDDLRQRHRERKLKRGMAIIAAAGALMAMFAAYSTYTALQIRENYQQKQVNQSKYLADTAISLNADGDRVTAIQLAMEALPKNGDKPYVAQAEAALSRVLHTYEIGDTITPDRVLTHDLPVSDIEMNKAGDLLLSIDQGDNVYLTSLPEGTNLLKYSTPIDADAYPEELMNAKILANGNIVVGLNKSVAQIDRNGDTVWEDQVEGDAFLREVLYHEETDRVVCCYSTYLVVLRGEDGSELWRMDLDCGEHKLRANGVFSEDGSKVAFPIGVSIGADDGRTETLAVADLTTGTLQCYETIYRDVSGLCFTEYGLAAGSEKDEDQDYISDGDGMIEMIDLESGEAIWSYPYTFEVYTFTSTYLKLYHRSYTDTDGQMISSVLFTKDNQVGALDCESGGKKSHFYVSSSIAAVGRYPDSGLIAVYESSGTVDYFNADTATEYRDNATSLGLSISKLRSNGEVMAIYQSTSPEVYLLKKHPGEGKQSLTTLENSIRRVVENEAENLYVVQCYSENALHVFDRDTMEEIYTFLSESSIYGFDVMDNGNLVVYYPGEFWRIDPKSGSKSVTELPIESCYNVLFYPSCQCAVAYSASGIVVYSYAGEETYVTYAGEGLHAKFVTLSADGTTLLVMTMDNELYVVNVAEETAEKIEEGTLKVLQNLSPENGMVLNTDGTLLAMSCMDGFVRVYDMAQETVIAKFAAVGRNRIFLAFSPDSRHLLLQADDYYFKVYDLESASVMMAAANQYNQILRAQFDETAGKVVLYGYDRSYILNADTYELTSYVEEGVLVNFARDLVLTHNRGELLSYPYLDLEELLALAGREVNGEELSEEKRLQLHVE